MIGATRAAAIAGPALIAAAWWAWASSGIPGGGAPGADERTAALAEALASDPAVLVVGNSQALWAIDPAVVGQALGVPGRAATLTWPAITAPGMWALLAHGVYGEAGGRPRLVVVAGSLDHLTSVTAGGRTDEVFSSLVHTADPVLDAKVFHGRRLPWLERRLTAARSARDGWLAAWTAAGVGGRDRMDAARAALFGEIAGQNMVANVRAVPVAGPDTAARADATDLDDTLIGDLIALAEANGARLAFVTLPQRSAYLAASPERTRELALYVQSRGAAFLDLEPTSIPPDGWQDGGHLSGAGRDRFTEAFVDALLPLDPLGDGPMATGPVPLPAPSVEATGTPPTVRVTEIQPAKDPCAWVARVDGAPWIADTALHARGFTLASPLRLRWRGAPLAPHGQVQADGPCHASFIHHPDRLVIGLPSPATAVEPGDLTITWDERQPYARRTAFGARGVETLDGWWIPAGGSLRWTWADEVPAGRAALVVQALHEAPGSPTWTLDGQPGALARWGRLWAGAAPVDGGPTEIRIEVPADGPALIVQHLRLIADGGRTTPVVGRVSDRPDEVALTEATPARWPMVALAGPHPEPRFVVGPPHDAVTTRALKAIPEIRYAIAGPLEVRRVSDGAAWPAIQHEPGIVVGQVPDGEAGPWSLAPKRERATKSATWLQPGEAVTLAPAAPEALAVPADHLALELYTFPPERAVDVRVTAGERVLLATTARGGDDLRALPLWAPAPVSAAPTLTLTAPPDAWVAVTWATLAGSPPPGVDPIAVSTVPGPGRVQASAPPWVHPPDATATAHGEGDDLVWTLTHDPGANPIVCLPPVSARAFAARAEVRLTGGAVAPVGLETRWYDDQGDLLPPAQARGPAAHERPTAVDAWLPLAVDGRAGPGQRSVQVCVRRGPTDATLEVRGLRVDAR